MGLAFGAFTQWTAIGLMALPFGAIYLKDVKWKTGIWGERTLGWHYDYSSS
jgi:hypothetical protein